MSDIERTKTSLDLLKRPGFLFVFILAVCSQVSVALGSLASVAGVIYLLFNAEAKRRLYGKDIKIILTCMAFFIAITFFTNFFSSDIVSSQKLLLTHLQRWLPFFLVIAFVRCKDEWWLVVGGLLFSTFIADVAGIKQAIQGMSRPIGFERNPIYYANELVLVVLCCFGILANQMSSGFKRWNSLLIGVIVASCIAIALSMTRGAWVALVVGLILFSFLKKSIWQNKYFRVIALLAMIIIMGNFFFNATFHERCASILMLNHGLNTERFLIWHSAWNMFMDYPLTGVGMGEFDKFYQSQYMLPTAREPFLIHPHNSLLNFLSENGVLGGISFLALFLGVLRYGMVSGRWGFTAAVLTVGFLVGSMTDHLFTVLILMRIYWLLIGLIVVAQRVKL